MAPTFTGAEAGSTNSLIFNNAVNVSVNLASNVRRGASNITFVGPNVGAFEFTNTGRWVLAYGGKVSMDSSVTNAIKIGRIGFGTNAGGGTYTLENNAILSTAVMSNVSFTAPNTNTSTMILTGSNTGTNRFDSASGNVAIIKNGTGRWDLSGSSFTGNATINSGTVGLSGNNALGSGVVTINGGTIGSVTSARTMNNAVTIGGDFQLGGLGQSTTFSGNWNLGGVSRTITLGNSATFSGSITNGALNLINAGGSTPNFTLSGTGSTFTSLAIGGTVNLQVGSDTALGSASLTVNGGSISANGAARTINNAITLNGDLGLNNTGGANQLTIGSNLDLGSSTRTFTVTNTSAISGVISGSGGSLIKAGSGLLSLNSGNTYSGNTTVAGGTLALGAGGSIGGGSLVNVQSGATLDASAKSGGFAVDSGKTLNNNGSILGSLQIAGTLSGSGTNSGAVTVQSGGLLKPGNSPGVMTFSSDLTLSTGGNMVWELWANTEVNSPLSFDQIVVGGNLSVLGSFGINLDFGTLAGGSATSWADTFWDTQRSWILFDVTGSTTGAESLSLLNAVYNDANGVSLADARSGASFSLSQVGSDVVVNYVPEPSTPALLVVGLLSLLGLRVSRRKSA